MIKEKLRFLVLALVRLNGTREISYNQKAIGNLFACWETKGRRKFAHPSHKRQVRSKRLFVCFCFSIILPQKLRGGELLANLPDCEFEFW